MATILALWVVSVATLYAQLGEEMVHAVYWKESFADSTPPVLVNGLLLAALSFALVIKVRATRARLCGHATKILVLHLSLNVEGHGVYGLVCLVRCCSSNN